MYSQMKTLACRFKSSYQGIFIQVGKLLQGIKRTTEEKMEKISQKINSLAGQVSRQAKEERKKLEKQKKKLELVLLKRRNEVGSGQSRPRPRHEIDTRSGRSRIRSRPRRRLTTVSNGDHHTEYAQPRTNYFTSTSSPMR